MEDVKFFDLDIVINAILQAQKQVTWKLGKAYPHLRKRISLGHLPENATIETYEEVIHRVLTNTHANVYIYCYQPLIYPTLTSTIDDKLWLVMLGIDGILETAFPPENPDTYLSNSAFTYLGILENLLK